MRWCASFAEWEHDEMVLWARLLDAVIELYPDDEDLKAVRENDRREREPRELEKEFGR